MMPFKEHEPLPMETVFLLHPRRLGEEDEN